MPEGTKSHIDIIWDEEQRKLEAEERARLEAMDVATSEGSEAALDTKGGGIGASAVAAVPVATLAGEGKALGKEGGGEKTAGGAGWGSWFGWGAKKSA